MENDRQTARVRLTTLTPVHIGSGQTFNKGIDFVADKGNIGIVDLSKVVGIIGEESIDSLTATIEKGTSVLDFVRTRGGKVSLHEISSRVLPAVGVQPWVGQLKEQYRTVVKGPCIPGSSLKGAIRTAVLADIISQAEKDFQLPQLSRYQGGRTVWRDAALDSKVFGGDATDKTTRFLHVGDVQFDEGSTEVCQVKIANQHGEDRWGYKDGQQVLAEAISAGQSASLALKLDGISFGKYQSTYPERLKGKNTDFITGGYEELCELINYNMDYLLVEELKALQSRDFDGFAPDYIEAIKGVMKQLRNLPSNACVIRVGGNSGWDFMTGGWMKYGYIKDKVKKQAPDADFFRDIRRKHYGEEILFPKTRKITANEQPFGFVKLTFE